jgi:hypothetical protein
VHASFVSTEDRARPSDRDGQCMLLGAELAQVGRRLVAQIPSLKHGAHRTDWAEPSFQNFWAGPRAVFWTGLIKILHRTVFLLRVGQT